MNCLQATEHFSAHFEDELDYQHLQGFEAHLSTCANCQQEYTLFQETVKAAQQLPQIDPSPHFMPTLQQRLAEESREPPNFWQRLLYTLSWPRWVFASVMVLICITAGTYLYQGGVFNDEHRPTGESAINSRLQGDRQLETSRNPLSLQIPLARRSAFASQPTQQHYMLKRVSYTDTLTGGGL